MRIKKRNSQYEAVDFNKISTRIRYLVEGIDPSGIRIGPKLSIDHTDVAKDVIAQIIDGISSNQLDEFAAELCAYKVGDNLDFGILADRLINSNHHKNTIKHHKFSDIVKALYHNVDQQGNASPLLAQNFYETVMRHKDQIDPVVDANHIRDYQTLDYFGFKTVQSSYLLRIKNTDQFIQERYQHLLMRVSLSMYLNNIEEAIVCYESMSLALFSHATPTLFNSGTRMAQLSSCFLADMADSIDGMYEAIRRLAHVSKGAGGIGLNLSKIRAEGSPIRGTNGQSLGLLALMKVLNEFARHVNQGGKRRGSIAVYLEPWHADIMPFLDMKKNQGKEELRARDLFYALMIPSLFMKRVKRALLMKKVAGRHNIVWSLMCPDQSPGLNDLHSSEFEQLYESYERKGQYVRQVDILTIWQAILDIQKEMGVPYMLFKDHINSKNNQENLGIIRISNLCVSGETMILTDEGYQQIGLLDNQSVNIWNGEQFSQVVVHQTGTNQQMMEVSFSNGAKLKCTPYHKFYIQNDSQIELGDDFMKHSQTVEAKDLIAGMKLIKCRYPKIKSDHKSNAELGLPNHDEDKTIQVTSLKSLDLREDTYCFNEPLRHAGIFNGIISGNCSEIVEWCSPDEYAVCNLASINLKKMVRDNQTYDYDLLHEVAKRTNKNLNRVIDVGTLPVQEARRSNFRHRAVATGVQGLTDAFILMGFPYESLEAQELNKDIFETMYHGCLEMSCELAQIRQAKLVKVPLEVREQLKQDSSFLDYYFNFFEDLERKNRQEIGLAEQTQIDLFMKDRQFRQARADAIVKDYNLDPELTEYQYLDMKNEQYLGAYSTFVGSPAHQGILQYDMWKVKPSGRWDFEALKAKIKQYGLRNSLVMAVMPTATTAQILGSTECIEALSSNLYSRGVLCGTYVVANRQLQRTLTDMGLWNTDMKDRIMMDNGSIAKIEEIPQKIRDLFKTVWDMSKKTIIKMSADRGAWIDQTQSLNLFIADPTDDILTSCYMYAWELGLKTGMYYLRRRALVDPKQFSIDMSKYQKNLKQEVTTDLENYARRNSKQDLEPPVTIDPLNPCASGSCGT